jgi:hypothetical protein
MLLILCVCSTAGTAQEQDERAALQKQQQALQDQVATLKAEQDFLLFRKAMFASDSKYLVLNMTDKTGQLKYKNRVLKGFRFSPSKKFAVAALQPGMLVLTKKSGTKSDRHALLFGTSLLIQRKGAAVPKKERGIPVLSLPKEEMQSVFFAVEEGATAYLLR